MGGTIRWRRYLDHLISSLCHNKDISSMEPLLLQVGSILIPRPYTHHLIIDLSTLLGQILRIGFYEILKLDMPPYAVVDEVFH